MTECSICQETNDCKLVAFSKIALDKAKFDNFREKCTNLSTKVANFNTVLSIISRSRKQTISMYLKSM